MGPFCAIDRHEASRNFSRGPPPRAMAVQRDRDAPKPSETDAATGTFPRPQITARQWRRSITFLTHVVVLGGRLPRPPPGCAPSHGRGPSTLVRPVAPCSIG